jgi:hypothetical protein
MKTKKSKVQGPKSKERACLRCGCTQNRACAIGCGWIFGSAVCDACLTLPEAVLYAALMTEFSEADNAILEKRSQKRLEAFGRFINELAANEPIPYRVVKTKKGGGK